MPTINKTFKPRFFYGFEFEGIVECNEVESFKNGLRQLHPKIHFGVDSSIIHIPFGCCSIEFQTPKLSDGKAFPLLEEILSYLWLMSENNIFSTNSSCGLHVNMSEKNIFDAGRQIEYYSYILESFDEDSILKTFGRFKSTYCRPFKKTNSVKTFQKIFDTISYLDSIQDDIDYYNRVPRNKKYYSVALRENPRNHYEKNHRIEFRGIGNKNYHLRTKDLTKAVSHIITVSENSLNNLLPFVS